MLKLKRILKYRSLSIVFNYICSGIIIDLNVFSVMVSKQTVIDTESFTIQNMRVSRSNHAVFLR